MSLLEHRSRCNGLCLVFGPAIYKQKPDIYRGIRSSCGGLGFYAEIPLIFGTVDNRLSRSELSELFCWFASIMCEAFLLSVNLYYTYSVVLPCASLYCYVCSVRSGSIVLSYILDCTVLCCGTLYLEYEMAPFLIRYIRTVPYCC